VAGADFRTTNEGPGSRFGAVFTRSLNPMLVIDDERRYVDANRAACLLLRMTRDEILSHRIDDFTPAEEKTRVEQGWPEFIKGGNQEGPWEFALPDGSRVSVRYSASANVAPGLHLSIFFFGDAAEEEEIDGADPRPATTLTPRERELLRLVALGSTGEQIATELALSPETVRTHLRNARRKLGARSRAHAVALALQRGEIEL
jgi:PAS domain S-box-containing protein